MGASLPNPCAQRLPPSVVVFGSGASGRWLGLGEGMKVSPHEGIRVPTGRGTRDFGLSLPDMRTQQEGHCLQTRKGALT